jgi:hypothetical protein
MSVLYDKGECVPRRLKETVVCECNLDVCILGDVFDAVLEQPEHPAGNRKHDLHPLNFFAHHAHLSTVVLEDYSDCLADRNNQCAESNRGPVINCNPFEASPDGAFSLRITVGFEIPDAG